MSLISASAVATSTMKSTPVLCPDSPDSQAPRHPEIVSLLEQDARHSEATDAYRKPLMYSRMSLNLCSVSDGDGGT